MSDSHEEPVRTARITSDPSVFNGKPIIRGRRLAVEHILEMLVAGDSPAVIREGYPWLEQEDVEACLAYAGRLLEEKPHDGRVDRTVISVTTLQEADEKDANWWSGLTPDERIRHLEILRRMRFGPGAPGPLQRVREVVEKPLG